MENPEVPSDVALRGRESIGEGSADLEKLLQTAEAENLQMVKLIDTERQRSTEFQKKFEETTAGIEELEESTKKLDIEAKQLHSKFKQNREICESLKKTSTVLDEHEEALRKKLEMISLERQTQLLQQQQDIEKYEKIWASYLNKYEEIPMAKELSRIKGTAMKTKAFVREMSEQITAIQSQIVEMEVEKTHMQEYLQGNPETATESIIKIADLFLNAEKTATKAREKVQRLQELKSKLESPTQRPVKMAEDEDERNVAMESSDDLQVIGTPARINAPQQSDEDASMTRSGVKGQQSEKIREEIITTTRVSSHVIQLSGQSRMQVAHQRSQGRQLQNHQTSNEQAPGVDQTSSFYHVTAPRTPSSNRRNNEQEPAMEQPRQSSEEACVVTTTAPNTPSSTGHVTPVNQSAAGTVLNRSAARSPLDLNKHLQYIRQVAVSPGEGFTYTGRSMYGNNQNQEEETTNEERETDGISYETPLNDQHQDHDISLNFFKPFEQQQQGTKDQDLFQESSEPSPGRNRSIFNTQPSPSNTATSSPAENFSFGAMTPSVNSGTNFLSSNSSGLEEDASSGQAAFSFGTSSSDNDNDFLSSRTPNVTMFGQNNNQANDQSFEGGFSLFGSSSSPNQQQEDSGGFSFTFGGEKSPTNSNNGSSGFFLF